MFVEGATLQQLLRFQAARAPKMRHQQVTHLVAMAHLFRHDPCIGLQSLIAQGREEPPELFAHHVGGDIEPVCAIRIALMLHPVSASRLGAHRLRHTAATEMLRGGASLSEIAQVLRHRHLDTTAIYAKVDRVSLRQLAQPWPGGDL